MKNLFGFFNYISHNELQKWTPIQYSEYSGSIHGLFELSGKATLGLSYLKCVLKVCDGVF